MGSYILRRVLMTLLTVWAALSFMFCLIQFMPGDAVDAKGGEKAQSAEIRNNLREKYGLNDPVIVQYGKFFGNLAKGDLGYSFRNSESVNKVMKETVSTSLRLLVWGGVVQVVGSFMFGFISAARRGTLLDKATTLGSIALQAIPVFVSGLLAQYLLGVIPNKQFEAGRTWVNLFNFGKFRWPQDNEWRLFIFPKENWKGIVLPAVIVGIVQMAYLSRLLRSSMLEQMRADYLRTAFAKGLSRRRVLVRHALRNALIPYVTALSLALVEIFGIAVQTESLFNLSGLGSKIADGALIQDAPVVLGLTSIVIVVAAMTRLFVDLAYVFLDPRIKLDGGSE
jgi:oligopeptide transport system permease protein